MSLAHHLVEFSSQNLWLSSSAVRVAYSDASNTGYGGYMVEHEELYQERAQGSRINIAVTIVGFIRA